MSLRLVSGAGLVAVSLAAAEVGVTLHVAPAGDDRQPGSREAPLATLAGARDRVRQVRAAGQPVTVWFAAGTYRFGEAVTLGEADSGNEAAPVVYRAEPGAEVRFSGARPVGDWRPVTDAAVLDRLAPEARAQVLVADLRAQGITDYGTLSSRGFARGSPPAEAELFWNDAPLALARWPNEGFRGVKRCPTPQQVEVDVEPERLARWAAEPEPWVFAYWHHDWAELYEPLVRVDPVARLLERSAEVKPQYAITAGRARWYALNLLCELDAAGEYVLDRAAGMLYVWPPAPAGQAALSQADGLLRADALSHVTFRGFTFEACRGTALALKGGTDCQIVGCVVRNTGLRGVTVDGGTKHQVVGCDVYQCGEGGIGMTGGERPTLTPAGHNAENNHVHHYSRRARTYKPAIAVGGVGNRVAHNLIHDGPHMALSASGNDHVVEYNEIHNVVYESGDAGAYYVGRDWTQRGTVLRYNYWHQIVGGTGYGGMTIYLDDQHCGTTIHGNLFERCSQAVFIGGGDDNLVTNNVFLGCWKAAHLDNRGMGWQKKATDDEHGELRTRLRAMPYTNVLWQARYPTLAGILADEPNTPKRNVFARNLSAGGVWDDIHKGTRQYQTVQDNLAFDADPDWVTLVRDADGRPVRLEFRDPAAVAACGFEPLPLERMGLYADERRASWPVQHEVRPVRLPDSPKPKPDANLPPNPTQRVPRVATPLTVDGAPTAEEWGGLPADQALALSVDYTGTRVDPPVQAWLAHDGQALRIALRAPLSARRELGRRWGASEAVEVAARAADGSNADILVLRGYTTGTWETTPETGAGETSLARLQPGVQFAAKVDAQAWTGEWSIPLANLGVVAGDRLRFNLTVRRTDGSLWIMWRPTHGNSWLVDRTGTLELAP